MAAPARERAEGKSTSPLTQYYVEVLREDRRLHMLTEMVHVLKQYGPFGMAIICSGRDTLDDIITGLSRLEGTQLHVLHGNLEEWERVHVMANFRHGLLLAARPPEPDEPPKPVVGLGKTQAQEGAEARRDYVAEAIYGRAPPPTPAPAEKPPPKKEHPIAQLLVATDAASRGIELPPQVSLITSYNLPPKKDVHTKRLALLGKRTGRPRNVVHFCVTSQSADFTTLQSFAQPARLEDLSVPLCDLVVPLKP